MTTFPKAFVNILLFDKDFNFLDIAYEQIDGGEQPVGSSTKTAHDHLMREYTVREEGYAYVYISNENPTYMQVYFDDVTITHTPTRISIADSTGALDDFYNFFDNPNEGITRHPNWDLRDKGKMLPIDIR